MLQFTFWVSFFFVFFFGGGVGVLLEVRWMFFNVCWDVFCKLFVGCCFKSLLMGFKGFVVLLFFFWCFWQWLGGVWCFGGCLFKVSRYVVLRFFFLFLWLWVFCCILLEVVLVVLGRIEMERTNWNRRECRMSSHAHGSCNCKFDVCVRALVAT